MENATTESKKHQNWAVAGSGDGGHCTATVDHDIQLRFTHNVRGGHTTGTHTTADTSSAQGRERRPGGSALPSATEYTMITTPVSLRQRYP